ncbi:hypothetical protein QW060_25745 [Myroides ceti]|uniref:Uncharacterized protein n=1 Tax=Paenimyroides ceti TaxID=395087 RepID=A0ABT8D4H5_9FLAO|nr:hypothetical protein [Paenimyroides ceti]MDN3710257.1 hypothetical protein [Paenimyroides ceti]
MLLCFFSVFDENEPSNLLYRQAYDESMIFSSKFSACSWPFSVSTAIRLFLSILKN